MTYSEAVNFMEKQCSPGSIYGLERITELLERLGNPERKMKLIHIAGTNGKGSVSRMLQSVLTAAGYRTGCFNSPFLASPREYLSIDGTDASEEQYAEAAEIIRQCVEGSSPMQERPTEFELSFALAVDYFYRSACDIAIIECGLGGLTDATNCIPAPELAIITNIGLDHVKLLGNTIKEIAVQKCGIIKKGCSVVAYPSDKEAVDVIIDTCLEKECDLHIAGSNDRLLNDMEHDGLKLSLKGEFQKKNASVVLQAAAVLNLRGYDIDNAAIRLGLENTVWPARFEIALENPPVILDGGHNMQCIDALCESLDKMQIKKVLFVIGVMADKAYSVMFDKLSRFAVRVITTEPANPRRLGSDEAAELWRQYPDVLAESVKSPRDAIKRALEQYASDKFDAIVATGSLYMMGEIRDAIHDFIKPFNYIFSKE